MTTQTTTTLILDTPRARFAVPVAISNGEPSSNEKRVWKLFRKQNGLCWICNQPMLPPNFSKVKSPNRWMATLDHLVPKRTPGDWTERPKRIAHEICNNKRHHNDIDHPSMVSHIAYMSKRFSNASWVKGLFSNAK